MNLALITGATSGLGKALSQLLAEKGVPLFLVARNQKKLEALQKELPTSTLTFVCDLASKKEREALLIAIKAHAPDLIINNAGFGLYGPVLSHDLSSSQEMMQVNVDAVIEISITAAQTLREQQSKGTIVNISSSAAFFPFPFFSVYAASKACIQSFSQSFDEEMKQDGIRILSACPGQIDTPFRMKASKGHPHEKGAFTMTSRLAAQKILEQVNRKKSLVVLDWRYRIALFFTRMIPRSLLFSFLKRSLSSRIRDLANKKGKL